MKFNDKTHSQQFSATDPRLTTYALGEMDAAQRAAFEAEINLANNPAAQAAITEIRSLTGEMETALAAENAPETIPVSATEQEYGWRAARESEARAARARDSERGRERKPFRFPYFLVAGLATACFAVAFFTLIKPDIEKREREKLEAQQAAALAAAAASGTVVIDGKTYVAFTPQAQSDTTIVASAPVAYATASPYQTYTSFSSTTPRLIAETLLTGTNTIGADERQIVHLDTFGVTANSPAVVFGFSNEGRLSSQTQSNGFATGGADYNSTQTAQTKQDRINAIYAAATKPTAGALYFSPPDAVSSATWGSNTASSAPDTESYTARSDNTFQRVLDNPLSTFSADVDTASYTNIRRLITAGRLPPPDAVRAEEMINYFSYNYAPPAKDSAAPFAATMEVSAAPWNPEHRLVRIGIKAREIDDATRPPASLVFLIDVSGSMDEPNKLPLVKESLRMLVNRLRPDDRIAIVTYANGVSTPLASTPVSEKSKILDALDALGASGGTNGGQGIQLAYEIAKANFIKNGANRVILCTDGDFNIGITDRTALTSLIEEKAKSGVFLTVLGFGMGNLKDSTLQLLADKGNGNHGYIDTRDEARRLLVEQTAGTLITVAKDVKLQVEFNPAQAASYRLIGYEKRLLAKEDFNNDKVDAGEIGAGHTVTALYEVIPANLTSGAPGVDPLKYQPQAPVATPAKLELKGELLTLKIRYKTPSADMSDKVEFVLEDRNTPFSEASADFKFTTSVAAFAMLLRDSPDKGIATYDRVLEWAEPGITTASSVSEQTRRAEFTDLVRRAKQMVTN